MHINTLKWGTVYYLKAVGTRILRWTQKGINDRLIKEIS